jgi:glutamate synthase (NADPH/NADH) large chain
MNPPVANQLPDVAYPSEAAKEVALWQANAAHLAKNGLYDPADEHGSCGVGLIVAVDGKPRREVVKLAIDALKAVWHRGAVDADGKTGDGAGLHVQIPQTFFREHVLSSGFEPGPGKMAVGMTFLPRVDLAAQERCRVLVEREILREGYKVYGWRQVPVRTEVIGEKASLTRPEIEQILIGNPRGVPSTQFELDLFVIRRRIERAAQEEAIKEFYFCSLSCRSIIYKGMFVAEQLSAFYPDLEDERFTSSFAIFHQRYSTNTFPTWSLAQPFRVIAHNGEINTLKGNLNWLQAHEPRMAHERLNERIADVLPVVPPGSSDSAALDAIFELMTRAGRHLPEAKALLIPEAWSQDDHMPQDLKDFYAWCNAVIEPWDGPAAICGFGGRWVVAGLDRNGLRPLRWGLTRDGLMFAGSETGMVRLADDRISHKGQLGPGQMIAVDLEDGQFYDDAAVKRFLAGQQPYSEWVAKIDKLGALVPAGEVAPALLSTDELRARQRAVGISAEDLELILQPMAETGKEAIGSMGDDAPLAVLSEKARPLHHFFRQDFSQVTNPPIDSLRERRVMSIRTRLGNLSNVLASEANQCRLLQLESPVVTAAGWLAMRKHIGDKAGLVDCTFDPRGGEHALRDALTRIRQEAEALVRSGCEHLFLTDEALCSNRAGTPMILATGAVHTHLLRCKLRTFTSLNVRSAECMDVHFVAVLIGVGATTVHPWLTEEAIAERVAADQIPGTLSDALGRYGQAIGDGLLKILAKMGISVLSSYRGGAYFEALGLSRTLVAEYFPGMPSRISGIGLSGIQGQVLARHAEAFWTDTLPLDAPGLPNSAVAQLVPGGFYRWRAGGERHTWEATTIHLLQEACTREDFTLFSRYSERLRAMPPSALRDLLDFRMVQPAVPVEEGESITALRKRLLTPGMSLGALSDEAHSTLNIAMNRIGARSDSGEGGEDPARFAPRPGGDNASAAIKQVASGRFGVTAEYLAHCKEIEIKIAQGAKPGEGGQLPGFKVTGLIARLRYATPGVTLISPPPHHDIYSIEDLAQLIYDLKQASPQAEVCVKLVSRSGIGAIAAGVAKAKADVILISGHVGGTGASPQSSVKFAGGPWELGLAETHQVLVLNRLAPPRPLAGGRRYSHRPRCCDWRHVGGRRVWHRHRGAGGHGLLDGPPMPQQHLSRGHLHPG